MSEEAIARLEERIKSLKEQVGKLEANQKWAVVAILGLALEAAVSAITGGF